MCCASLAGPGEAEGQHGRGGLAGGARGARLSARAASGAATRLPVRAELLGVRKARLGRPRIRARDVADGEADRSVPSVPSRRLRSSAAAAAQHQRTRTVMEKRVIVAAMLMAGLLMLYQTFFLSPSTQHPQPTKTETPAKPAPGAASTAPATAPGGSSAAAVPAPVAAPAIPERAAEIVSPLYRATVSSRGGELREWELNYRGQKPLVIP